MTSEPHRPRRARGGVVPPPAAETKSRWRTRRARIAIIALSAIAVLVIIGVAVAYSYLGRLQTVFEEERNVIEELDTLDDETSYRTPEGTVNILLMGSDSRGDEESEYRSGLAAEDGERSDVMMFVHIPADRSGVYMMSIMRDLWLEIPGHGEGRVNSALSTGGLELAVDTVEELLYTHIDHVVTIDFESFQDLTEALGGVYVDNPQAFSAGATNPNFYPEGTIRLEGDDALRFVRERQSFARGDYVRVENQQLVMRAIAERFLSGDTLTNPQRIIDVLEALLPYMGMDSALNTDTIVGYAMDMRNIRANDIHTFTMPTGDETVTAGGAQVILPDEEMTELLRRSLHNENMAGFVDALAAAEEDSGESTFTVLDDDENVGVQLGGLVGGRLAGTE